MSVPAAQEVPSVGAVGSALEALGQGFEAAGWRSLPAESGAAWRFVARTSAFRWRWMATRLHTFVFVIPLSGQEDVAWLDGWLRAAVDFARANKGGLPEGFQTGSAAMVIAVGSGLSPEVRAWADRVHGRKFGAITHPVIADVGAGDVVEPARTTLGGIYYSYLRTVVSSIVRPAVEQAGRATGV